MSLASILHSHCLATDVERDGKTDNIYGLPLEPTDWFSLSFLAPEEFQFCRVFRFDCLFVV